MNPHGTDDEELIKTFEAYLRAFVERTSRASPVHAQIAFHLGYDGERTVTRGKRLRPRLVAAAARACGGPIDATLAACTAVELLHNYSLIHDDIEDGDRMRHGRTTVWAEFGMPHGVNAGDAVGALAQLALAPVAATLGADVAMAMALDLADANLRMCEGQALDLHFESGASVGVDGYLEMISGKTAALFACAGSLGARAARASAAEIERCADVGRLFGIAFQIGDDADGIWGDAHHTGKSTQSDLSRRKKSYPIVWAMERDPSGAGRAVAEAYARPSAVVDDATVDALRDRLESAGARDATIAAARDCLARARARAAGIGPLEAFLDAWSKRSR
ncbi:MAG TPA: polyprenyl synthetase family protein [Candidatus Eremiobacteraceae bacterium]|nr:polyprenyl synthetase family protein [Candidatus Eremiobacteraceae bacterium]